MVAGLSWPGLGGGNIRDACGVCGRLKAKGDVVVSIIVSEKRLLDSPSLKSCPPAAEDRGWSRYDSPFHAGREEALESSGIGRKKVAEDTTLGIGVPMSKPIV